MIKEQKLESLKDELTFSISLIRFESKEISILVGYAIIIGLLSFGTTVSIQFLINSISFTGQSYQIALLSSITVLVLLFISALQIIRNIAIEKIEQRVLVRLTLASADQLSFMELSKNDWSRHLIVHRFFDAFNYQVHLSKLLLDGLGLSIITALGLIFILFYHPILALLTLFIVFAFILIVFIFFKPGIETRFEQSTQKYKLAAWLSFISESRSLFKNKKSHDFAIYQTDLKTKDYLQHRQVHFNLCLWQQGLLYFLQAVGAGVFLGVGGFFVLMGKINLGQLVAVEFIVLGVLYGLSAFARSLESFYALVVSAKKMRPLISSANTSKSLSSIKHPPLQDNFQLVIDSAYLAQEYTLKTGDLVRLIGADGATRRSLLWTLTGSNNKNDFSIAFSEIDWTLIPNDWKHEEVLLIDRPTMFDLNLTDNILLKRKVNQSTSPLPSFNELPEFLVQIYANLTSGNALNWADDPRTRLYVTLFRTLITDSRIILIDSLFDELSQKQQKDFVHFFMKTYPRKILIVNSCVENKEIEWSQEITWKTE